MYILCSNGSGPVGVKKVKKQDDVKETTEASDEEDEKQEEECVESEKVTENGNDDKEGSAEEDDSDEDGPELPTGLTGKHDITWNTVKHSLLWVIYGEPGLVCLVIHSFQWEK